MVGTNRSTGNRPQGVEESNGRRPMVAGASVGALLRERREALGASLAEVEAATKIRQKYLSALEADEWQVLPGEVVGRGFLRNYASYLGLEPTEIIERRRAIADPSLSSALAATSAGSDLPPPRAVDYRPKDVDLREEPESLEERTPPRIGPFLGVLAAIAALVVLWWGLSRYGGTILDSVTEMAANVTDTVSGWFSREPELVDNPALLAAAAGEPTVESTSVFEAGTATGVDSTTGGERTGTVDPLATGPAEAVPAATEAPAAAPPPAAEAPTATPAPPAPTPVPPTPVPAIFPATANTQANLRASPSLEAEIVGGTTPNQAINLVGQTADGLWYRLDIGSWIFGELVTGAPAGIPVLDPNALPPAAAAIPTPTTASAVAPAAAAPPATGGACSDQRSIITAPASGQTVAGVVPISGNATHENFASYKLEAGVPGGALAFIGSGNTQITGGQLGSLDSLAFPNGPLVVRLTVIDQAGNYPPPCDVTITVQN
jgi:cytoskeletal protein RodZ